MRHAVLLFLATGLFTSWQLWGTNNDVANKWHKSSVSRKHLLGKPRFFKDSDLFDIRSVTGSTTQQDSLSIVGIRVQFQADEDEMTTGNGQFDLSISTELIINPPPHDRSYFENQLKALSHYYSSVSGGQLILTGEIPDRVFTLHNEMGYYNPGTTEEATNKGLAELFRDAVAKADSHGVNFSEYDCIIIFHAGVGRDIDFGYDPTPMDIPSVFLNLQDLQDQLAGGDPDFPGIGVQNNTYFVTEGMILPETQSQEGYEIGLLGTAALMFGFQLGLPALWNTRDGLSGIGKWGLMDQGSGNYRGLIPAEPCAWSKIFLGWVNPVDTLFGEDLKVACSHTMNPKKIYRIPVNDHEYFLIENRMHDPNGDGITTGKDNSGVPVTFLSTGQLEVTSPIGVIVEVDEYDYDLPGSGILIWHIDEKVIEGKLSANRVNEDKEHKGVDLEEADGAQDIGEYYDFLEPGSGSETGVLHDAWFAGNEIHMLANGTDRVEFTPESYPSSSSNSGANTNIIISHFSDIDTVMTFTVGNDLLQAGFPQEFGMSGKPYTPMFGDLDGNGDIEIIVATDEGKIFVWKRNGDPFFDNQAEGVRITISGDTLRFPVALFADAGEDITAPPVVGDLNRDGLDDIIAAYAGGRLMGWTGIDNSGDGLADLVLDWQGGQNLVNVMLFYMGSTGSSIVMGTENGTLLACGISDLLWQVNIGEGAITGICQYDSGENLRFIATTESGAISAIDGEGNEIWKKIPKSGEGLSFPASAWFYPDQEPYIVALADCGEGFVFHGNGEIAARFGDTILSEYPSDPALADVDQDGFMEIVLSSGSKVWIFNHNGTLLDEYPLPTLMRETELSSPIIGDVNGDGSMDVLVTSADGNVEAYSADGSMIYGFPLSAGGSELICPLLLDLDSDGDIELTAVTECGYLWIWDLSGEFSALKVPWGSFAHDPMHSGMNPLNISPQSPDEDLMPSNLVYNYPNPTQGSTTTIRYRLERYCDVWIQIFDLSGELVDEFSGPGEAQTENEVVWDLSDIESGVYIGRVYARIGVEEKAVIFKIAVVK